MTNESMGKHTSQELTLMQYIYMIHGTQVGVGILTLPRQLAEGAGTDGWISLFLGWIVSVIASLLIVQSMKPYPNDNWVELLGRFFGKWGGKLGLLLSAVYFSLFAFAILTKVSLYIKNWMLQETPQYVIICLLLLPAVFIVPGGLKILGRYGELAFIMKILIVVILMVPLIEGDLIHLRPLLKEGWGPVFHTAGSTLLSFLGFEMAFFCYPALQKKQYASSGIIIANSLTLLLYLYITIVCFVHFSPDEITQFNDPPLTVLKTIELRYVERFDIIALAFYLFVVSTCWMPFLYAGIFSTSRLVGKRDHGQHFYWAIPVMVIVTFFLNPSFHNSDQLIQFVNQFGIYFAYILPMLVWMYGLFHQRLERRRSS